MPTWPAKLVLNREQHATKGKAMAIRTYPAAAAKKWVQAQPMPCDEGVDFPPDIMNIMTQSKTAKAVYDYVFSHKKTIHIIFFKQKLTPGQDEVRINGAVFDEGCQEPGPTVWYNLADKVYNIEAQKLEQLKVPPALVFFHELGHAKQWLENEAWYKDNSDGTEFKKFGYNKTIEDANLRQHEWPICDELPKPFPRRTNYPRWCGKCADTKKLKAELVGP